MTSEQLKERVIAIGIASVQATEAEDLVRQGCLFGFEICRTLRTFDDFVRVLNERHRREQRELYDGDSDIYWRHRHATLQIEHTFERMKVVWGIPPYSAMAIRHVAEIMAQEN